MMLHYVLLFIIIISSVFSFTCVDKVTLTSTCPDVCTSNGSKICILYPSITKCIDAPFGKCYKYSIHNQICHVHCILLIEHQDFIVRITDTTQDPIEITARIEYIAKLSLLSSIRNVRIYGQSHRVSFHPRFLTTANSITRVDLIGCIMNSMPQGSLPSHLTSLSIINSELTEPPEDLESMTRMRSLYLQGNKLGRIPRGVFNMKVMIQLNIRNNRIQRLILTKYEFEFLKKIHQVAIDPIQSLECPPYSKKTKWIQDAFQHTNTGLKQPRTEHFICIIHDPVENEESMNTDETETKENYFLWIGISIAIVMIMICIIYIYYYRKKLSRKESSLSEAWNPNLRESNTEDQGIHQKLNANRLLQKKRLKYEDIHIIKKIGVGGFAHVSKAMYNGELVAVKKMIPSHSKKILTSTSDFASEIEFTMRLRHRSIVNFIGVAWTNIDNLCAVVEFMDRGDLHQVLASTSPLEMSWKNEKWSIMVSIAEGLLYLHSHSPSIIHRDLKSRNVLLDSVKGTKLSDFGLSRYRKDKIDETSMTKWVGTFRWMAPEMFRGENYTEKVDIYAFGLILVHLSTHELPFIKHPNHSDETISNREVLYSRLVGTSNLSCRELSHPCIRILAHRCLSFDSNERPSAAEIVNELHGKIQITLQNLEEAPI